MALTLLNSSDETELTSLAGFPANASVTTLQDGGWVVAWQSDAIDPNKNIFFRRFDSSGEEVAPAGMSGTEIRANTITAGVSEMSMSPP